MNPERRPERSWAAVAAALNALGVALQQMNGGAPAPATPPVQVTLPWSVLLARSDLAPDTTLLSVGEAAEALGLSRAAIYKRTSRWHREHGTTAPLPHLRIEGALRFEMGTLRRYVYERRETVLLDRAAPLAVERHRT